MNGQVLDSVASSDVLAIGAGSAAAMTMTDTAMAGSIGIVMQNAASAERGGQLVAEACTAKTCALIIANAPAAP